jgi:hypothetical protein
MTFEHPIILLMIVFTMIMSCHLIAAIANAVKVHHARRRYLREIVPSLHQIVQDLNALQNDLRDFLDRFDTLTRLEGTCDRRDAAAERLNGGDRMEAPRLRIIPSAE